MADRKGNFLDRFAGAKQLNSIDFMNIWTHYDRVRYIYNALKTQRRVSRNAKLFPRDGSGYLEPKELDNFLTDFVSHRTAKYPTAEVLADLRRNVLATADVNRDGKIELGEFANLLPVEDNFMRKFSTRKQLSRKDFNDIFMHYDPDGNGFIEGKELLALIHDILSKTEGTVTLQSVNDYREAALQVFDKNTDGRLSRKELGLLLSIDR